MSARHSATVMTRDGAPVVRRMLNVALSVDNYVLDGRAALALARSFKDLIERCDFVEQELCPRAARPGSGARSSLAGAA